VYINDVYHGKVDVNVFINKLRKMFKEVKTTKGNSAIRDD
jgi:hypothetical protein